MGDTYIANTSRDWLGRSLLVAGDYTDGMALLEAVVDSARESGDTFSLPMALSILGAELALRGDDGLGFAYLDEAATIARRGGLPRTSHLALALQMKALVLLARQDTAARPILDELTTGSPSDTAAQSSSRFTGLAMVDVLDGDLDTRRGAAPRGTSDRCSRRRAAARSWTWSPRRLPVPGVTSTVLRASCRKRSHRPRRAPMARDLSLKISVLEMLARVLLAAGKTGDGVRLLAATQAARAHHRLPEPPSDNNDTEEALAAARPLLGAAETDRAWAEGLAMTLTDAIAFAQNQRA